MGALVAILLLAIFAMAVVAIFEARLANNIRLSDPRCAKCDYDIRVQLRSGNEVSRCPECGSDLSKPEAILWGRYVGRRPKWTVAAFGGVAILLILLIRAGTRSSVPVTGPFALPTQTTAALLAGLPAAVSQPWHWQELEKRLSTKALTNAEAVSAINILIASIKNGTTPQGPLHWSGNFTKAAMAAGIVPEQQKLALYQAFYGTTPQLTMRSPQRAGKPIEFSLTCSNPWSIDNDRIVFALRQLKLPGGASAVVRNQMRGGLTDPDVLSGEHTRGIDGRIETPLPIGSHSITFVLDMGIIPATSPLVGLQYTPGQKERWVKPKLTWSAEIPFTLQVVDAKASLVAIVDDPAKDPTSTIKTPTLLARRNLKGATIDVQIESTPAAANCAPVMADLVLKMDTMPDAISSVYLHAGLNQTISVNIGSIIPPEIKSATIILRPNVKRAEADPQITEIWGKEILFKDVSLDRYDLPTTQP